jgi:hypothetical protein
MGISDGLGLRRGEGESEDVEGLLLREPRTCTTICLNPGTIAVGPKYRKYGTCVRLPELTEVRPLAGLSPTAWASNSLFASEEASPEEGSSFDPGAFVLVALSAGVLVIVVGAGSGELLSTARELRWLVNSFGPERRGGARDAESDCVRRCAVDSVYPRQTCL